MNKCDICGIENDTVKAGRWIFYCSAHKHEDWEKTYDNELAGREDYTDIDGEVSDMMLEQFMTKEPFDPNAHTYEEYKAEAKRIHREMKKKTSLLKLLLKLLKP